MANINISPNMNLPIPTIGVDPGPDWASNINASLTLIDQHNHASGSGVQITPAGLNINSDLVINGNNLTLIKTVRFQSQVSVIPASSPNLECIYVSGVDLYYNDGSGNQVRITQGGVVTGGTGSINNLTSPASASYNSGSDTFIWESASNTAANMDFGSAIFRNITANSNGITLSAPNALASNYTLTLPSLPSVQSFMTLDNSGNIAAPWTVDNSTLAISGSNVIVKTGGITSTQIATHGVAQSNLYVKTTSATATAGNVGLSIGSGVFGSTNTFPGAAITNLSITLVTTGRPVIIQMIPDIVATSVNAPEVSCAAGNGGYVILLSSASVLQTTAVGNAGGTSPLFPTLTFLDQPTAGTQTYSFNAATSNGSNACNIVNMRMIAYEL